MKRKSLFAAIATVFAVFAVLFVFFPFRGGNTVASAASVAPYRIDRYRVDMTVSQDRSVAVTERLSVSFGRGDVHGIIRDLPLDGGIRYGNLSAECDSEDFSPYTKTDDISYLSFYLRGNGLVSGQSRLYTISYVLYPPKTEEGYLPLDVVGYGWYAPISDVEIRVAVPDGLTGYKIYSGIVGSLTDDENILVTREGNDITLKAENLSMRGVVSSGVTLDLQFEEGALETAFDFSFLYAALAGATLILLILSVKFLFCRPPHFTTTINLTAPEEMDPLLMGALIDSKVDGEDLGALIFYLADEGYLNIDFRGGKDNPTLIKTDKELSPDLPDYICDVYRGLFSTRNRVTGNELNASFYATAATVKNKVSLRAGKIFEPFSMALIGVAGLFAVLLLGGFVFLYNLLTLYGGYFYWMNALLCLISYSVAAAGALTARRREYKWSKGKRLFFHIGAFLLGLLPAAVCFLFRSPALAPWTEAILVCFASFAGFLGGGLPKRTKAYSERLGQILGFRQFIRVTEKDKIEFMLSDNPQLYYHILPYAQVLGVTEAWTDKFRGLDMKPPVYAVYGSDFYFDILIWNSLFRNLSVDLGRSMVSKPAPSGGGYHHSGGFGGGFGGGGFGGGGGRAC